MTAKPDRLDEYVRQANQLDDGGVAALADATARQALLRDITRQPVGERPSSPRRPARRRIQLAAAALGVVVVALAVAASTGVFGPRGQRPPMASDPTPSPTQAQDPDRYGDPFGAWAANSCVPPERMPAPTFAFDGTVAGIGAQPPADPVTGPAVHVPVTFTVNRWFRGGSGERVTVAMSPPAPGSSSVVDEHGPGYTIGSRLLVSGSDGSEDPGSKVAWPCGFTLWYNRADAQAWERAGGYAPFRAMPTASGTSSSAGRQSPAAR
jgi:hypothetical protein